MFCNISKIYLKYTMHGSVLFLALLSKMETFNVLSNVNSIHDREIIQDRICISIIYFYDVIYYKSGQEEKLLFLYSFQYFYFGRIYKVIPVTQRQIVFVQNSLHSEKENWQKRDKIYNPGMTC